jgi:hypothetical protein
MAAASYPRGFGSIAADGANRFLDNVDDYSWFSDAGCVIDGMLLDLRLDPLGHVPLCFGHNHAIVFGDGMSFQSGAPPKL